MSKFASPHLLFQSVVFLAFLLGSVVFVKPASSGILMFLILGSLFLLCPTEVRAFQRPAVWMLLAFRVPVPPLAIGADEMELKFDHLTRSRDARTVAEYRVFRRVLLFSFLGLRLWQALWSAWAGSVRHMLALSKLICLLINSAVVDMLSWWHFWGVLAFCWFPVDFAGLRRSDWKLAHSRADVFFPSWDRP